jgi:hypothetical protein
MTVTGPVQVGHELDQLLEMLHGCLVDSLLIQNRDDGWQFRSRAFAIIGRDDNFFQNLLRGRRGRKYKNGQAAKSETSPENFAWKHGKSSSYAGMTRIRF